MSRLPWILTGLFASSVAVADFKPDFGAVVRDLQMTSRTADHMTLVFWLPIDYWRLSLKEQGNLSPAAKEQFLSALQPYLMVAAVDAEMQLPAAMNFTDDAVFRKGVFIEDQGGNHISPLDPDSLPIGVKNVVDILHPLFANLMGPLGSHLQVFVFPATGKDGKQIADATKAGSLTVHAAGASYRYRLPLGSLLPPTIDPKTGESFPGSYHFNPFTGGALSLAPEVK